MFFGPPHVVLFERTTTNPSDPLVEWRYARRKFVEKSKNFCEKNLQNRLFSDYGLFKFLCLLNGEGPYMSCSNFGSKLSAIRAVQADLCARFLRKMTKIAKIIAKLPPLESGSSDLVRFFFVDC